MGFTSQVSARESNIGSFANIDIFDIGGANIGIPVFNIGARLPIFMVSQYMR